MNDPLLSGIARGLESFAAYRGAFEGPGVVPKADPALASARLLACARRVVRACVFALDRHDNPALSASLRALLDAPCGGLEWLRTARTTLIEATGEYAGWWCAVGVQDDATWRSSQAMDRYMSTVLLLCEAQAWLVDVQLGDVAVSALGERAANICCWGLARGGARAGWSGSVAGADLWSAVMAARPVDGTEAGQG